MTGEAYVKILQKLKKTIQRKRKNKWESGVLLLHDNASSHTCRAAQSEIQTLGFTQVTHPPYSPDLAPSDYHLFPKMKEFLRQRTFTDDTSLEKSTLQWLQRQPREFYERGISALPRRWEKCVTLRGGYVEK